MGEDYAHRAKLLEDTINKVLDERAARGDGTGEVSVVGPFGVKLSGKGRAVIAVFIVVAILAGLYFHDVKGEAAGAQRQKEHMTMDERLNEVVYVLTLSQAERERLNLAVPDSLRRKQRAMEDRAR